MAAFIYPTKGISICSLIAFYSSVIVVMFAVVITSIELFSSSPRKTGALSHL
jgi:hypothetical protein